MYGILLQEKNHPAIWTVNFVAGKLTTAIVIPIGANKVLAYTKLDDNFV